MVDIIVDTVNNLIYFGYLGIHSMNPDGTNITTVITTIPTEDLENVEMRDFVIDMEKR